MKSQSYYFRHLNFPIQHYIENKQRFVGSHFKWLPSGVASLVIKLGEFSFLLEMSASILKDTFKSDVCDFYESIYLKCEHIDDPVD